jgi:hypothetical protein
LLVAFVAMIVGEIPAAFELAHPLIGLGVGLLILYVVLRVWGKDPEAVGGR